MKTLEDIVTKEGLPCLVEHADGERYQVLGVDPFRTSYYYCVKVVGTRPIRGGEAYIWKFAKNFTPIKSSGFISPEEQRAKREQDRMERNAKQTQELTRGRPTTGPTARGAGGKVLPFRKKEKGE